MSGTKGQIAFMKIDLKFMAHDPMLSMQSALCSLYFSPFPCFNSNFPLMSYSTSQNSVHSNYVEENLQSLKQNSFNWHGLNHMNHRWICRHDDALKLTTSEIFHSLKFPVRLSHDVNKVPNTKRQFLSPGLQNWNKIPQWISGKLNLGNWYRQSVKRLMSPV